MGDWKTITVTERSSERLLPASFTSQVKMSPSNMQYTPLPHSRSSYRTLEAFCTSDNLDQCLSYLDQELTTLGYFSLYEDAEKENGRRELNVVSALNNMNSLLLLHRKNLRIQEDAEMQHVKLLSDMEHLQSIHYKQKDQLETSRKDLISIQEKDRQLQCKSKHLHQLLKNEKEEVQKLQNLIASRAAQYNHNIKRKEREYNKLKERLHQLVMDKKEKKMAIDILNYVGRADGKRSSWRTSKTDAKNEEEMYKVLLNDYEQRQKQFMVENAELKKVLQQMKKEMIYILTPRKQSKERSEDSFGTTQVLSDAEEDVADSGKDNVSELTCEIAREQLTNSIRQQWRILKNHVEKLDNQVSLVQDGGGLKDQDVVKREVHEEEVEKLQAEIVQCSEIIKTQQQLLQQYFTNPCDDETTALLKGCYLLEDKERLQEEWRLFREQRKNFEQERRNFTEAAIRLGHEKQMFEEDRATWLKQQFLQMTSLIDLKNPERVKSPSACFENPEEEEYRFHGRSHQKKLHSAPAAVASRSAHKLLPSTPTMEICNTPHPMPGESSRTVLLKRLELDGTPTWNGKEFTNLS